MNCILSQIGDISVPHYCPKKEPSHLRKYHYRLDDLTDIYEDFSDDEHKYQQLKHIYRQI